VVMWVWEKSISDNDTNALKFGATVIGLADSDMEVKEVKLEKHDGTEDTYEQKKWTKQQQNKYWITYENKIGWHCKNLFLSRFCWISHGC
jgi:hypothetical protein